MQKIQVHIVINNDIIFVCSKLDHTTSRAGFGRLGVCSYRPCHVHRDLLSSLQARCDPRVGRFPCGR